MDISRFKIKRDLDLRLSDLKTNESGGYRSKANAKAKLDENIVRMADLQGKLYAQDKYALLIIFQAMDTAGKDGTIKHVMSGLNPQSTQVHSFKQPSAEELNHDYLWRPMKNLPERGAIGIFNRSYYEEVLVVRVHNLLNNEHIPGKNMTKNIWKTRFRQIRDFEKYLFENGIIPIKFFLHISKKTQAQRLLERIENKTKNWKFSAADLKEREYWNDYQKAYQEAIRETSTNHAPWYVIPADKKWFAHLLVSEVIAKTMESLNLDFPTVNKELEKELMECKRKLMSEE